MRHTIALSWGAWGGFYIHPQRICLGWVAITVLHVELDELMRAYVGDCPRCRTARDGSTTVHMVIEPVEIDLAAVAKRLAFRVSRGGW